MYSFKCYITRNNVLFIFTEKLMQEGRTVTASLERDSRALTQKTISTLHFHIKYFINNIYYWSCSPPAAEYERAIYAFPCWHGHLGKGTDLTIETIRDSLFLVMCLRMKVMRKR